MPLALLVLPGLLAIPAHKVVKDHKALLDLLERLLAGLQAIKVL